MSKFGSCFGLIGWLLVQGLEAAPVVIWASDPVRPGETVVVRGDGFGKKSKVEVSLSGEGGWKKAEVLQQTERTLKFVCPSDLPTGLIFFRIQTNGEDSQVQRLNGPKIWWIQGDQVETATIGGWIRLFGLNLGLKKGAKVVLRNGLVSIPLRPVAVDDFNFQAEVPAGVSPGAYEVEFERGEGSGIGKLEAGKLDVVPPPKQRTQEYKVNDFGAKPGQPDAIQYYTGMKAADQVDSTESVQKALQAAGKSGGGIVSFSRGIYILSKGLEVPAGVILRGAGRGQTALSWVDDQLPREKEDIVKLMWGSLLFKPIPDPKFPSHPYLIRGPGHFGVEDLAIYAVNHRAGILSDFPDTAPGAGHVKIRRVLMRLNRFINVQRTGRHYADAEEVFLRRWKDEPRGGANSQGAIHLNGPNLEVVDCDIYSSMSAMIFNGASGVIARNRIGGTGRSWTVMGRKTRKLIFEGNRCLDGGICLLNVHMTASHEGKAGEASNFSREIYCARNSIEDCYVLDRDGGFVSDFHSPLGVYTGWAKRSEGTETILASLMQGDDLSSKWAGAMVSVLDGKGAGQVRFMKSLKGDRVETDEPWQVPLNETSFLSISKTLYRGLFIDNLVADAGNAVSLWGGGVEMVVAGNRSERGGAFNQITLCHGDQFIPGMRAQFLDNIITEGINWGASYAFPRGSLIGTYTYTPLYFERVIQKNKGQPVTAPDYRGPLAIDQIFRRNRIESAGNFYAGGRVGNILFEEGEVKHSRFGVDIRETGGRWDDSLLEGGPVDILIRNNKMIDVTQPYCGDYLKNAKIVR
jgi:hypothetical protein